MLDKDAQRHNAPGQRAESILYAGKITTDQRKQVARLWMRIVPDHEMPPTGYLSPLDEIAIREQNRRFLFVCLHTRGVNRHYIRPVRKIGNSAEAFGLALRAIA